MRIWLSDVRTLRQSKRPCGQYGTWGPVRGVRSVSSLQAIRRLGRGAAHQRVGRGRRVVELREDQRSDRPCWRVGRPGARLRGVQVAHAVVPVARFALLPEGLLQWWSPDAPPSPPMLPSAGVQRSGGALPARSSAGLHLGGSQRESQDRTYSVRAGLGAQRAPNAQLPLPVMGFSAFRGHADSIGAAGLTGAYRGSGQLLLILERGLDTRCGAGHFPFEAHAPTGPEAALSVQNGLKTAGSYISNLRQTLGRWFTASPKLGPMHLDLACMESACAPSGGYRLRIDCFLPRSGKLFSPPCRQHHHLVH